MSDRDVEEAKSILRMLAPQPHKHGQRAERLAAAEEILRLIASLDGNSGYEINLDASKRYITLRRPRMAGPQSVGSQIVGHIMYDEAELEFIVAAGPSTGNSERHDLPFEDGHFRTVVEDTFYVPVPGEPRVHYQGPVAFLIERSLGGRNRKT